MKQSGVTLSVKIMFCFLDEERFEGCVLNEDPVDVVFPEGTGKEKKIAQNQKISKDRTCARKEIGRTYLIRCDLFINYWMQITVPQFNYRNHSLKRIFSMSPP
jgi:hypothetical protein